MPTLPVPLDHSVPTDVAPTGSSGAGPQAMVFTTYKGTQRRLWRVPGRGGPLQGQRFAPHLWRIPSTMAHSMRRGLRHIVARTRHNGSCHGRRYAPQCGAYQGQWCRPRTKAHRRILVYTTGNGADNKQWRTLWCQDTLSLLELSSLRLRRSNPTSPPAVDCIVNLAYNSPSTLANREEAENKEKKAQLQPVPPRFSRS